MVEKPATFESEPFSEEVWQVRQLENPLIARALNRDITKEFLNMLKFKIDHLEIINMNCVGQVRSGKSFAMYALATIIGNYTKIPFDSKHVLKKQSDYVQVFKEGKPNELFIIDEYEVGEFGIGSNAEIYQEVDLARIAAKRILHKINLCGEETGISTNAGYQLVPMGRDFENFQTKLIVYKLERGQEIPMGYIIIPLKPVLCDDMILHVVKGCLQCPKYDTDECRRDFPKNYEKEKDENIKRITQQNFNWRARLRIEIAEELSKNAQFAGLKKKERIIYARNLVPRYTNRVLTEKELEEIVVIAGMASENPELLLEIKGAQPKLVSLDDDDAGDDSAVGEDDGGDESG